MTRQETPSSESQLNNSENSAKQVEHTSPTLYFRPDTEMLVLLSDEVSGGFDKHGKELADCVDLRKQAGEHYSSLIEKYGLLFAEVEKSDAQSKAEDEVAAAQAEYQKRIDELKAHIGEFAADKTGYEAVIELIPIKGTAKKGGRALKSNKYHYVKKGYFDGLKEKNKLHIMTLRGEDRDSAKESIYINGRIDTTKLRKQLTDFKPPKLSPVKFGEVKIIPDIDETLKDWADSWNFSANGKGSSGVDVSAGAQFMRFTSNLGAAGEFDPENGTVTTKVEGSAVLTVASACARATLYYPDRIGWALHFKHSTKDTDSAGQTSPADGDKKVTTLSDVVSSFNMGMMRVKLEADLVGFLGASVQAEGQVQVVLIGDGENDQQLLSGRSDAKMPPFKGRRSKGAEITKMEDSDKGVRRSAEVFGGAKVEASLKGVVQWLEPKSSEELRGLKGEEKKAAADFKDICTIGGSIAGMIGIGRGSSFHCFFRNGKFHFKIAASLCCGPGAKGAFICDVNTENFVQFGSWLVYQLFILDYRFLEFIAQEAFEAYTQLCVLNVIEEITDIYKTLSDKSTMDDISTLFRKKADEVVERISKGWQSSKKRNEISLKINSNPQGLLKYTPEAKGILLFILTRHGVLDHADTENYGDDFIPDIYGDRKKAIILVLESIQTKREWQKVMLHRTADGSEILSSTIEGQERELRGFLNKGKSRAEYFDSLRNDLDSIQDKNELDKIYNRLKNLPSWGYPLVMNSTPEYALNIGVNQCYRNSNEFNPILFMREIIGEE